MVSLLENLNSRAFNKVPMVGIEVVDAHAHLDQVEELEESLERAGKLGVRIVLAVSANLESCKKTLGISEDHQDNPKVLPALGIHPWDLQAENIELALRFIEENLERAVGIGEVGLDYWLKGLKKNEELKFKQQMVFGRFIELGKQFHKPLLIHSRGAWEECLHMVRGQGVEKAVFHWFSGPLTVLRELLNGGYYISASPAAEYSVYHQEAIRHTPIERILLETDCPVKYREAVSEPAHVVKSLQAVAKLKNLDVETVARVTTKNALEVLGLKGLS